MADPTDVRLEELIGRGATGRVYRARVPGRGDLAAKLLPPGPAAEAALRQAPLLTSLVHPGIARVLEVRALSGGEALLLIDPLAPTTLRARLQQGSLPAAEAARLLEGILDALDYAHGRGVVHGDLKPENVLLTGDGRPVLCDLGAACLVASEGLVPSWVDSASGLAGPGSPCYWAPERTQGAPPAPAWDLFAVGVMAFELLTGALPAGPELPSDRRGDLPAWADAFYRAACARLEQRVRDALAARELLPRGSEPADPPPSADAPPLPAVLVAPVAPGVGLALDTDRGRVRLRLRGVEREHAARLELEPDGAYRAAGPAESRAWERYLQAFPQRKLIVVPRAGGWAGVPVDAPGELHPLCLARPGLHAFDRVLVRRAHRAHLFERHDPLADAATAAKLRELLRRGESLERARVVTGDAPLLAAFRLARDAAPELVRPQTFLALPSV